MREVCMRLKHVCRLAYGDALRPEQDATGNIEVFGSNGQYAFADHANTLGPAIIVGRKGSYGKVNWSPHPCFASDTTFFIDSTQTSHDLRWLFWALQTIGIDKGSHEAAVPGINREIIYEKRLLVPPVAIQRRIANFLDAETAQIDALVAEKERMLALLEEKRTALVSRTVTQGLNLNVPMKPSGLDWLGDIPVHWEVKRLKHFSKIGNGSTPNRDQPRYWEGGDYPWLNSSVVNSRKVEVASRYVTEEALTECHLPKISPPALLVAITGQGRTRGRSTVLEFEATINQHLAFIKPELDAADCLYLSFLLDPAYSFIRSDSESAGSTRGAITCEQLGNFYVTLPPCEEQKEILRFVEEQISTIGSVEETLRRSIALLKERRSALITAVVTGQLAPEAIST